MTNVCVCFAESSKGCDVSYLYDIRAINVETGRNVYWKKTIQFGSIPTNSKKNSDEKLYFGNNRGYWQLYFTYNNENYRINKNNAEFNLCKSDKGESLTIEITRHKEEYIYVKFLAPSGERWFYIDKTSMERGISIVVKNELSEEIADVCVLYAESRSKNVEDIEVGEKFDS